MTLFIVDRHMENRFSGTLSGFIFALFLTAIYWFIGFIILRIFNIEIRNSIGYGVCIIGGFVGNRIIPVLILG